MKAAIDGGGIAKEVPFTPSFVDGAGSGSLLAEMWEHAQPLVSGSFVVSLEETAATVKLLLERERIVAEGAAAMPVAAALSGAAGDGRIVCIVSGGNIDPGRLTEILAGRVPA